MDEKYERLVLTVSGLCLFAAAVLILLGLAGLTPTPLLVVALVLFTAAVYAAIDLGDVRAWYLRRLWVGALVPTLVVLAGLLTRWSAGELQALGGIVGMVGVINLFLRPVYSLLYYLLTSVLRLAGDRQNERSS